MSGTHKAPNSEKGARYLGLLDHALCNGNWNEISELARKVDKHAPERICLTLAARSEARIASASHRPTSAASTNSNSIHSLGELIPKLKEAVASNGSRQPDDAYAANTCIAQIHWLQQDPMGVLDIVTDSTNPPTNSNKAGTLGWLEVCAVKRTFLQADALDTSARQAEARSSYQYAVTQTPGYRSPELRRWTERLLARACIYSVMKIPSPSLKDLGETYSAFKAWAEFWNRAPSSSAASALPVDTPRRRVWKEHYDFLSYLVQNDLMIDPTANSSADCIMPSSTSLSTEQRTTNKSTLRSRIKRVEATYESLLLEETKFPKSSQTNTEVEEWVEQVIRNWKVFSGSSWTNAELENGGKQVVSRGVLEILYRAATKTFHSTAILRQLFTVHASLGEFDLAMHAMDSYVTIVDGGKARAEKTGEHELGFDDDDTAVLTAVEAIRVLCRYGDREQAEKANHIREVIRKWLKQQRPTSEETTISNSDDNQAEAARPASQPTSAVLKPQTLCAAHRAIGISQAHWAYTTYESESRTSLLAEAHQSLRHSLELDPDSLDTAYALAIVLADMREVAAAADLVKGAIATAGRTSSTIDRRRQLVPLLHVLALCLTGEDAYDVAASVCNGVFEQFTQVPEPSSLDPNKEKQSAQVTSTFAQMEGFEKENLLQVKMTQILLFELIDGAEDAVDFTGDLLTLYGRLFQSPGEVLNAMTSKVPPLAPQKSGGTLRSIAGSIRPRSIRSTRGDKDSLRQPSVVSVAATNTARPGSALPTSNEDSLGPPIAITVTNEDGVDAEKSHHRHHHLPHLFKKDHGRDATFPGNVAAQTNGTGINGEHVDTNGPQQPIKEIQHNVAHDVLPPPAGHERQPPVQDLRLPAPHPTAAWSIPEPQLSVAHQNRHQVNILIDVWIFIAQLYIRANGLEDAQCAFDEALKLIELLEIDLAASEQGTSARRLYHKGWGGGKSIDELWADVWCTKALLSSARDLPFEAMASYEQALTYFPDHPAGIIGLSDLLMDIYEEKLPPEQPQPPLQPLPSASGTLVNEASPSLTRPNSATTVPSRRPSVVAPEADSLAGPAKKDPTPAELNRLAARDRAYMLLLNLTKLGTGRDSSEAWFTLARAHELSREITKAKKALWWVVQLEENRMVRGWRDVVAGGITL